MSREEAISLLTQVNKILVNSNSWLENTHEPLNMAFDMAIKALEQEPISETDIILTREEYGELVSSEYDNGYAKGYREALEQEPIIDKIRAEIVKKHLSIVEKNGFDSGRTYGYEEVLDIIDKYKAERNDK